MSEPLEMSERWYDEMGISFQGMVADFPNWILSKRKVSQMAFVRRHIVPTHSFQQIFWSANIRQYLSSSWCRHNNKL